MKTKLIKLMLAAVAALTFSNCSSTGGNFASPAAGTDAIMCDKCKTVWVRTPTAVGAPGRMQTTIYRDSKSMTCPDCAQAVEGFGKSLSAKHVCSSCGGTMTHCTQH